MPIPAAKKALVAEEMLHPKRGRNMSFQKGKKKKAAPKMSNRSYRGNKARGGFEQTSGKKTKLTSLKRGK